MKKIKWYVDAISEEIEDAKTYAENYVEAKAMNEPAKANHFREMSNDELRHATLLHEMAVAEIEKLNKVFIAPAAMQETWNVAHKEYVEKAAWVKQMLSM